MSQDDMASERLFQTQQRKRALPTAPCCKGGIQCGLSRKSDLPCFCPVVFSASPSLISLPKRAVDLSPSLICPLPEGLGAGLWGLLAAALPTVHFLQSGGSRKGWPGPWKSSSLPDEGEATQTFTSFPVELTWTLVSALGPAAWPAAGRWMEVRFPHPVLYQHLPSSR